MGNFAVLSIYLVKTVFYHNSITGTGMSNWPIDCHYDLSISRCVSFYWFTFYFRSTINHVVKRRVLSSSYWWRRSANPRRCRRKYSSYHAVHRQPSWLRWKGSSPRNGFICRLWGGPIPGKGVQGVFMPAQFGTACFVCITNQLN